MGAGISEIFIFTNNEMEGVGIRFILENMLDPLQIPECKCVVLGENFTNLLENKDDYLKKDVLLVVDIDTEINPGFLEFLDSLQNHSCNCAIISRMKSPGLFLRSQELMIGGYVSKSSPAKNISDCVRAIINGGLYYDACFRELNSNINAFTETLSPKELRIFKTALIFSTASVTELANILGIPRHSVEVHLSNIYKKAGVKKLSELITAFSLV